MRVSDLQRMVHADAVDGARLLYGRRALDDETVHASRKSLKRARAGLRLLRDATGRRFYIHANACLRDAARPLGRLRDAAVLVQKSCDINSEIETSACRKLLIALRRRTVGERRRQLAEARHIRLPERCVQQISSIADGIERRQPGKEDSAVIFSGVARLYRKGRAALRTAAKEPSDVNLHEARKQTKYLYYALKLIAEGRGGRIAKLIKRADAVGEKLGDDHDLVMVEGRLTGMTSAKSAHAREQLLAFISKRRKKLQKKALKKGAALYAIRPKALLTHLESQFG